MDLRLHVLKELGKIAVPQEIEVVLAPSLPKTRSGKLMRQDAEDIIDAEIMERGAEGEGTGTGPGGYFEDRGVDKRVDV